MPANEVMSATLPRWTDEKREELRAYREKHGITAAAEKYGVTPQRISQVLAKGRQIATSSIFAMGKARPK